MIKSMMTSLTDYNVWANKKIIGSLEQIDIDDLNKEIKSSYPTLRKTVYHIWDAQVIWLKRLQGTSLEAWPSSEYDDTFDGYAIYFLNQSEEFNTYIKSKPEEFFSTQLKYTTLAGKENTTPAWQIILHCMNHSTYHRGQIITMLRNLHYVDMPSTDYIFYLRDLH